MNLIDPFQFRDLFPSTRNLAVIGNSPSILQWDNGQKIDSAELIVRFNRARTAGLESKIGSRTDVLFVNASNSLEKAPPPRELCDPRCLVCFVSPGGTRTFDVRPFAEWAGDVPVMFTFGPDLIGFSGPTRQRPLTSGTYALYTLLRLFDIQRLFVTGFTMFGATEGGAGKYWNEAMPSAAVAHDLDHEADIFVSTLAAHQGQLEVTPEVAALAAQHGFHTGSVGTAAAIRNTRLSKRIAAGLAWRFLGLGMALRRAAESK
jgi:hypothetical protein